MAYELINFNRAFIIKRGHNSNMNKTIHYKIVLSFSDGENWEVLDTNSFKLTK
jgi:hypothetical protein